MLQKYGHAQNQTHGSIILYYSFDARLASWALRATQSLLGPQAYSPVLALSYPALHHTRVESPSIVTRPEHCQGLPQRVEPQHERQLHQVLVTAYKRLKSLPNASTPF